MSFTTKGTSEIIVAGLQDMMLVIDLTKGEVVKKVRALDRWGYRGSHGTDSSVKGPYGVSLHEHEKGSVHMCCY